MLAMSFPTRNRTSNRSAEPLSLLARSPSQNARVTHLSRIDAGLRPILSENTFENRDFLGLARGLPS